MDAPNAAVDRRGVRGRDGVPGAAGDPMDVPNALNDAECSSFVGVAVGFIEVLNFPR